MVPDNTLMPFFLTDRRYLFFSFVVERDNPGTSFSPVHQFVLTFHLAQIEE